VRGTLSLSFEGEKKKNAGRWLGPPKAGRPDLTRGERGAGIDPAGAVLLPIIDQDTTQLGVQHLSIDR
jgi:hypothetical protein